MRLSGTARSSRITGRGRGSDATACALRASRARRHNSAWGSTHPADVRRRQRRSCERRSGSHMRRPPQRRRGGPCRPPGQLAVTIPQLVAARRRRSARTPACIPSIRAAARLIGRAVGLQRVPLPVRRGSASAAAARPSPSLRTSSIEGSDARRRVVDEAGRVLRQLRLVLSPGAPAVADRFVRDAACWLESNTRCLCVTCNRRAARGGPRRRRDQCETPASQLVDPDHVQLLRPRRLLQRVDRPALATVGQPQPPSPPSDLAAFLRRPSPFAASCRFFICTLAPRSSGARKGDIRSKWWRRDTPAARRSTTLARTAVFSACSSSFLLFVRFFVVVVVAAGGGGGAASSSSDSYPHGPRGGSPRPPRAPSSSAACSSSRSRARCLQPRAAAGDRQGQTGCDGAPPRCAAGARTPFLRFLLLLGAQTMLTRLRTGAPRPSRRTALLQKLPASRTAASRARPLGRHRGARRRAEPAARRAAAPRRRLDQIVRERSARAARRAVAPRYGARRRRRRPPSSAPCAATRPCSRSIWAPHVVLRNGAEAARGHARGWRRRTARARARRPGARRRRFPQLAITFGRAGASVARCTR